MSSIDLVLNAITTCEHDTRVWHKLFVIAQRNSHSHLNLLWADFLSANLDDVSKGCHLHDSLSN